MYNGFPMHHLWDQKVARPWGPAGIQRTLCRACLTKGLNAQAMSQRTENVGMALQMFATHRPLLS